jgi:collagenase-like PrtC family protease
MKINNDVEIICPAGTPAALIAAVEAGADAVYVGLQNKTNARNFPGLNFSGEELTKGVQYAHNQERRLFLALNCFPQAGEFDLWKQSIQVAVAAGVDALIIADVGVLSYVHEHHPDVRKHVSVQAGLSNSRAINFMQRKFNIKRVVLPRVLTVPDIQNICRETDVEVEVFIYGGLCPMAEGRCSISSYVTGRSPNKDGVCSPPEFVRYNHHKNGMDLKVGDFLINTFSEEESPGYPTICKGRFNVRGKAVYPFEDPVSLNSSKHVQTLAAAGVKAFKIEGRQRGKAYVRDAMTSIRKALSDNPGAGPERLKQMSEGHNTTTGAYERAWK